MTTNLLTFEEVVNQAKEALASNNLDYATAFCHALFNSYPGALEATRLLGKVYLKKHLLSEADQLFDYLLTVNPHDIESYWIRGFIAGKGGNLDQAITYYERAFELDPDNGQLRSGLLRLYQLHSGYNQSKVRLTRIGLANYRLRMGLYQEAIQEYTLILSKTPHRLDVQVWLMEAYWRKGDYTKAASLAQELLVYYPRLIKANLVLWHTYGMWQRLYETNCEEIPPLQGTSGMWQQLYEATAHFERVYFLDPRCRVIASFFDNSYCREAALHYIANLGKATIPSFDLARLVQESARQPLIPTWLATSESARSLNTADQTEESGWLWKLLAETESKIQPPTNPQANLKALEAKEKLELALFLPEIKEEDEPLDSNLLSSSLLLNEETFDLAVLAEEEGFDLAVVASSSEAEEFGLAIAAASTETEAFDLAIAAVSY
ncbi:MAG: tetratricopeptide repeat protein, partial [Chloroflexota bacterium]